jgi:hypothetical protein
MIDTIVGPYEIGCQEAGFPDSFDYLRQRAALVVEDRDANRDLTGDFCCVSVRRGGKVLLALAQAFAPRGSGFNPGLALILETDVLFVGSGQNVRAFDLTVPRELWLEQTDAGFWAWARHGEVVLMLAELEFAAWDLRGRKLWTTGVSPPWYYTVRGGIVELDFDDKQTSFSLSEGPK